MANRLAVAFFLALGLAAPVRAADLDPKLAAKIKHEQKKALENIAKEHGNKKTSEMSLDERREVARQQSDASKAVLDKNGVTDKDYARYSARLSREQQNEVAGAEQDIAAQEKAAAEAAAAAQKKPDEVQVQRGFSNEKPVELETKDGAPPIVEHGLPADE